ncbi:hypothetical protein F5Y16DRAFT_375096 [Xylariaceae sp. FL0255]|nr:hypothetical protein F5Y16DRAFT_375096 [Xylariaceae sp. FL0255]
MDQSSNVDEPRERALSSEPSSTRPNPFADGDQSARKRLRISASVSRSASVETLPSQDCTPAAADSNIMKVDDPEPTLPSTPARSPGPSEPVSSRMTINLRNADNLAATPTSPTSPTPARQDEGHVQPSVEESELDIVPDPPADDVSSGSSVPDTQEEASRDTVTPYENRGFTVHSPAASAERRRLKSLRTVMFAFPYRHDSETLHDTLVRLARHLKGQPNSIDDGIEALQKWLGRCISSARHEDPATILEIYQEHRAFWTTLPEVFYQIAQKFPVVKHRETRTLISRSFVQFAKLAAIFTATDDLFLSQTTVKEASDLDLMSSQYLRVLGTFPIRNEIYIVNGHEADRNSSPLEPLDAFQSSQEGSLTTLLSLIEHHNNALSQFPRKVMDNITAISGIAFTILRDSSVRLSMHAPLSQDLLDRHRDNLGLAYKCFGLISNALDAVIEKSVNSLIPEHITQLSYHLCEMLRFALQSGPADTLHLIQDYRQEHPHLPFQWINDAVSLEWRFQLFCRLIKSRQMQLRVEAASLMCNELVQRWKRYTDRPSENAEESQAQLEFLRHLSRFITNTGIVDYILGPTCHPEIIASSGNIIGFLAVTKTYTPAQTDLMWQTLVSAQDPRVPEALVRMMGSITGLLQNPDIEFFQDKFQHISADSFTPAMKELFDHVSEYLISHIQPPPESTYEICVRLLRESSVLTAQGSIAYPDVSNFAIQKMRRLIHAGLDEEVRRNIVSTCLADLASRSRTTTGSLQILQMIASNSANMQMMVEDHNFTGLLIDDFEAVLEHAKSIGVSNVYTHYACGPPRRRFLTVIMTQWPATIGLDQGRRLWDNLVGDKAVSQDDRKAAWEDLNVALKRQEPLRNEFLANCLQEFLPQLPPNYYCVGSLTFVREVIIPAVNGDGNIVLDDDGSKPPGLELLWQMILTAPNTTIEDRAIHTLVNDIYIDSKVIVSYPLQRARKIHFSLAQRCLSQLKSAAQELKTFTGGAGSGDDELMVISVADDISRAQEFQFTRSLKVLITLLRTLQTKSHFTTPDLRSLMLPSPDAVNGDLAELKYQSFDEDTQTDVKTLTIGLKNSAASLLASIRDATGFDNYRLYYRGSTFIPSQVDVCKSLEELNIRSGLILVKKEQELTSSPVLIKPGASLLEIDILGHFQDLWEYLSMEEKLAQEIYHFLISLPADDSILTAFEQPIPSHRAVFPLGQPFKSLYAIYALREYLNNRKLRNHMMHLSGSLVEAQKKSSSDHQDALAKALVLIASAICDPSVIDQCSSKHTQLVLSVQLVDYFLQLLKDTLDAPILNQLLTSTLHERLIAMLAIGADAQLSPISVDLVHRCFDTLLECCVKSNTFWTLFREQPVIKEVIYKLLLADDRTIVRKHIAKLISNRSSYSSGPSGVRAIDFAEFFWPIVNRLFLQAVLQPFKCEELFGLSSHLLRKLLDSGSSAVDLMSCAKESEKLLLAHTSTEDIVQTGLVDQVAYGLIGILHLCIKHISAGMKENGELAVFPTKRLFLKHLFPPEDEMGPLVPQVVLHQPSRGMLYDIIYNLSRDKREQTVILHTLNTLVDFRKEDGAEFYKYDLPQAFDRTTAVRSPCGYSGLRNLSNTCYLNSLFTQLFMNIEFRRFILQAKIRDPESHQLLHETQILFANLQDSRRRFIDPQSCVEQIVHRDQPIDIHNQMDVDEFYILLFDRWEAQLTTEAEKKALRSIYGGQLVHQIKSQECEHISERIEPFSAIQCDVKGKQSLEESLQAYVDGEVMDGDNKYKCSTCDRHVDAVKRACLKELPDNLIFHLKRFDFNLRLLQRSKINDYFAFPSKIDMQPYTVGYLSDPSQTKSPDIFELVGILVHSGTAETGHYYSFIRERPTGYDPASWVEFNDETVTSWDPKLMESACFGGADPRPYDNGTIYEKVYSAYMLFYQRSSCLRREQEHFNAIGNARQIRTSIPPELEVQVKQDNWAMVQRHSLYDQTHTAFVIKVLERSWSGKCSENHKEENLAMRVAIGHLDQIVSRSKDLLEFDSFSSMIIKACQKCSFCSFAFFQYFQQHKDVFRAMLVKNVDASVRQDMGQTFLYTLRKIKANHPEEYGQTEEDAVSVNVTGPTILEGAADLFSFLVEAFHTRIGSWPEIFGTVLDFANFGRLESASLLDRDVLKKVLLIIMADQQFDLPPQYSRLVQILGRRMPNRPPNYDAIISLVDILLGHVNSQPIRLVHGASGRLFAALQGDPVGFTYDESDLLNRNWDRSSSSVFIDKLVQLNQNPVATDGIISMLIRLGDPSNYAVLETVQAAITGQITHFPMGPYLRTALTYCACCTFNDRVNRLIHHVNEQCKCIENNDARSFFEFQRDIFNIPRSTGDSEEEIRLQSIENIPTWAPGLLGNTDRGASNLTLSLLNDKLFKHGPSPVFDEEDGGSALSRVMVLTARRLAITCLEYLQQTYVVSDTQAGKDYVFPVLQAITQCAQYYDEQRILSDGLDYSFNDLQRSVLDAMNRLIVETIDDDPSGMCVLLHPLELGD